MLLVSMALAVPAPLAVPTPALGAPNNGVVDLCKEVIQEFPDVTLGDCIAGSRTLDTQGFGALACKLALERDPDLFYGRWDSLRECIKDYQD